MCEPISHIPPPECITFRTVRRALEECGSRSDRRGFHNEARLAYVVAKLRSAGHPDCTKAADFLMEIFQPL